MAYRRIIASPFTKSLRRQKEQRFTRVANNFFKDGATQHGRERIDRAMKSLYGHSFISMKHAAPKKIVKSYNKKLKAKSSQVKLARKKQKRERDDMAFGLWAISQGTK